MDGSIIEMCRFAEAIQRKSGDMKVVVAENPISGCFHHVIDGRQEEIPESLWIAMVAAEQQNQQMDLQKETYIAVDHGNNSNQNKAIVELTMPTATACNCSGLPSDNMQSRSSPGEKYNQDEDVQGVFEAKDNEDGKHPGVFSATDLTTGLFSHNRLVDALAQMTSESEGETEEDVQVPAAAFPPKTPGQSSGQSSHNQLADVFAQMASESEKDVEEDIHIPAGNLTPKSPGQISDPSPCNQLAEVLAEMSSESEAEMEGSGQAPANDGPPKSPGQSSVEQNAFNLMMTKKKQIPNMEVVIKESSPETKQQKKRKQVEVKEQWTQVFNKKPRISYTDLAKKGGLRSLLDMASSSRQHGKRSNGQGGFLAHKPGTADYTCQIDLKDPYGLKSSQSCWGFHQTGTANKESFFRGRCRFFNLRPGSEGSRIVYWVSSTPRIHQNFALQLAILMSLQFKMPLQVVGLVHPGLQSTSGAKSRAHGQPARSQAFQTSAFLDLRDRLAEVGVPFYGLLANLEKNDNHAAQCLASFCQGVPPGLEGEWGPAHVMITDEGGYHPNFERLVNSVKSLCPQMGIFGIDSNFMEPIMRAKERHQGTQRNSEFPTFDKVFKKDLVKIFWKTKPHKAWKEYDDRFWAHINSNERKSIFLKLQNPLYVLGSENRHIYVDEHVCSSAHMVINWKEIKSKIQADYFPSLGQYDFLNSSLHYICAQAGSGETVALASLEVFLKEFLQNQRPLSVFDDLLGGGFQAVLTFIRSGSISPMRVCQEIAELNTNNRISLLNTSLNLIIQREYCTLRTNWHCSNRMRLSVINWFSICQFDPQLIVKVKQALTKAGQRDAYDPKRIRSCMTSDPLFNKIQHLIEKAGVLCSDSTIQVYWLLKVISFTEIPETGVESICFTGLQYCLAEILHSADIIPWILQSFEKIFGNAPPCTTNSNDYITRPQDLLQSRLGADYMKFMTMPLYKYMDVT